MHMPNIRARNLYRPSDGNIENALMLIANKLVDIYESGACDMLLLGEINIDYLNSRNASTKRYKNFLKNNPLDQLTSLPTCITNNSATCIDHMISNRSDMYYQHGRVDFCISDHQLQVENIANCYEQVARSNVVTTKN